MIKKGFTLIELLVVIAIIALLLAILVPSLKKAKDMARAIHCVANTKSLSMAWFLYKDDYDDNLVWGHVGGSPYAWVLAPPNNSTLEQKLDALRDGALFQYTGEIVDIYRCPADRRLRDPQQGAYRSFSIANGANGEDWPGTHIPVRKYNELKNPGTKYIFVEDIDPRGSNVGSWAIDFGPISFIDPVAMWHNKRTTLGFADGHAEIHGWHDKTFIDWCMVAIDDPGSFTFNLTPPADEHKDLGYLTKGFPCKSHD